MSVAISPPSKSYPSAPFKFTSPGGLHAELRAQAALYFSQTRRTPRGGFRMFLDATIVVVWLVGSYLGLIFLAGAWWQVLLLGASLSCAIAAVGFKIQHDGNHGAFSNQHWINRLTGMGLDAIGGSSYIWRQKHNLLHHGYTNLVGADNDIDLGLLGRLSPAQPYRWWQRFQHIYLWPLYSVLAIKWQWFDDFSKLWLGKIGRQPFPRPRAWDLAGLVFGKVFAFTVALVVPALFHPLGPVLLVYLGVMALTGLLLAVVFQLAHSVGEADHPQIPAGQGLVGHDWAVHQVLTTVDFARNNPLITWFVGGLNFQVEHHLFPRIAHVHYPALSRIVEVVCARQGVRYNAHRSFFSALAAHFRFLREMGRPLPREGRC